MQVEAPPIPGDVFVPLPSSDIVCDRPAEYWSWGSLDDVPASHGQKRAINALSTDLVEEAIKPSASKRVSLAPSVIEQPEALVPVEETIGAPVDEEGGNTSDDAVIAEQQVCEWESLYFIACYLFVDGSVCW
jgi:hypothetical protein